jgi:hypothetical protein
MPANEKRKDHELTALYGVVNRCGIVISEKRPADFATKDIEGDIKRLLGKDTDAPTLGKIFLRSRLTGSSIRFTSRNGSLCRFNQIPRSNISNSIRADSLVDVRSVQFRPI